MDKIKRKLERARLEKMREEFNVCRRNCKHTLPDGTMALKILPSTNTKVECQLCRVHFDIEIIEEITRENIEDAEHQLRVILNDLPEYLSKYDQYDYNQDNPYKDELIRDYKKHIVDAWTLRNNQ